MQNSNLFLVLAFAVFAAVGCNPAAETELTEKQNQLNQNVKARPELKTIKLEDGKLTLLGTNLDKVEHLWIQDLRLTIESQDSARIIAKAESAFTFLVGKVYSLLIKSASAADEVIKISVETPTGQFEPTVLKGTGAGVGTVLKWNGTHWAPAPDYVGVGSNGPLFMGYTQAYDANLGGMKGANEKCAKEYPDSHWASVDELVKLGSAYPWTYPVWVREIQGRESYYHNGSNDGYPMGLRTDNCYGWTRTLHHYTGSQILSTSYAFAGSVLGENGQERMSACHVTHRLACVR